MIWGAAANGKFSTKSCYNLLRPGDISPTDTQQWDAIWHLKGPYRLRHFICLVRHDRLLTKYAKMCRRFGDTASCDLCGACEDSIHVLRDCPFATDIWRVLIPPASNNEFFGTSLKPWIDWNLKTGPVQDLL